MIHAIKSPQQPTTGERLCRAHDLLMYVTSLASVLKVACEGALDHDEQRLKNTVNNIGFTVETLNRMVRDAAEDVELCQEYQDTSLEYLKQRKVPPSWIAS